ncbi:MAG: LuxR C-terminal-related transcriptional regulator [Oscillospiraceae bacterium]|jgi:LuxR family maltose regulon positive regulatory protein|nr:LuxR C-terminal-related transcriptional regulator [Oscillospiraceae bacterium]
MPNQFFETDKTIVRPRVNKLLEEAVKRPLTVVRAGTGEGKTRAVYDFTRAYPTAWMQLSGPDNAGSRFWAKYIQVISGWNERFAEHCKAAGFPDTEDRINRHLNARKRHTPERKVLIVLDDVHLIKHPDVLRFLERGLLTAEENTSVILICRDLPGFLERRRPVPDITEEDLRFTESELAFCLGPGNASPQNIHEIMADTKGWAFSVSLVARSLRRAPGYAGYVRNGMRQNVFTLMETEVYEKSSPQLRRFLVRLTLIDHLSEELISRLAGYDAELLGELRRLNAYIRFDSFINAYLIHHLFWDFLTARRGILTEGEITETYRLTADWCAQNGFHVDALTYYEKVGDYPAIIRVLNSLPVQLPYDIALCAAGIFERAPEEFAYSVEDFAVTHLRMSVNLCRWTETPPLMRRYEENLDRLPDFDRARTLGGLCYSFATFRALMGTADGKIDFQDYYAKMDECLSVAERPFGRDLYADTPIGFWASLAGSSRAGAPQEYCAAAERSVRVIGRHFPGAAAGLDILCRGELSFYQGDIPAAERTVTEALTLARKNGQFEVMHKALFDLLRMALGQGSHRKAGLILNDIDALRGESGYIHRFVNYDMALAWFFCALRRPVSAPSWLQEDFSSYRHAYFLENTANQLKARVCYNTGAYSKLLTYISEMKRRESILYGRIELLALEACCYLRLKDRASALTALRDAYREASPNNILTPFAELGRDMRTLAAAGLRDPGCEVPAEWLAKVMRKSATFAKTQSLMIAAYEKDSGQTRRVTLSAREKGILSDLYRGLSRPEISDKQGLSVNTVNSSVNNIFSKLGARSLVDAVRIAAEENLL